MKRSRLATMPNQRRYDICDDAGVWVITETATGRWATEEAAQAECNKRNFEDGSAKDVSGELYGEWPADKQTQFEKVHYARADCTCARAKKSTTKG